MPPIEMDITTPAEHACAIDSSGWKVYEQGEPNQFYVEKNGRDWLAVVQLNGQMPLHEQRHVMRLFARAPELLASLQQIERLSREADRQAVDVASMLGDIAREAVKAFTAGEQV